ncbi:hypothetical protein D6L40_08765 [Vibrio alginolyticus]|uniref:lipopolysaccharide biosynthesis protein n=1 Tax=Vibrio TaxID=662 RepID=UPI00187F0973|nr:MULTISPECIES: polysaccharide biosynthesis C-terminal domain-containing protein [Vibrio]EGR1571578.1 hypothetical protein [Vibrio alginolyticus]EGX6961935.1 oligosaccharide flippase family protein [Vibrio alginolyticus]EJX2553839.1 polysaccharide biosynthesis C-terminal domain-containing protein [Vibrio alginolyticus]ELA6661249.1 polysaccharide biosynthesis C-terminal domain-containing protein [Vibrio alginolyticus]MBE8573571.1 polysaccharide biosynthesis C-terminal domain-containing protein
MKARNILTIAAGLISKFLLIISVVIISRNTSLDSFGTYEIALTSINLLFPLLCGGAIDGIFRFCIDKEDKSIVFSRLSLFGLVCFFVLAPISYFVLRVYFGSLSIYLILLVFSNILIELIKQLEKSNYKAFVVTTAECIKNLSFLALVFLYSMGGDKFGFKILILYQLLSTLTCLLFLVMYSQVWKYITFKLDVIKFNRVEINYCLLMMPNTILWWVLNASDKFILGYFMGPASVAIYAVATKFPSLITALNRIFMQIWHVYVVGKQSGSNNSGWKPNVALLNAALVMLSLVFYFCFDIVFDSRYDKASEYLQILLIGSYYSVLSSMMGGVYMREKLASHVLLTTLISAVSNIILNFIFIPYYGVMACIVSTVFSLFLLFILRLRYITRNKLESIEFLKSPIIHVCVVFFPMSLIFNIHEISFVLFVLLFLINFKMLKEKIAC